MTTFHLPDLGEGLQEAEIVAWHVSEGEHVVVDQPLVSVETEKAVVEIPSPQSGRIAKLHHAVGDIVVIGEALADIDGGAAADAGTVVGKVPEERAPPEGVRAAPAVRALARRLGVDLASVEPTGPRGAITKTDVERAAALAEGIEPLRGVRRTMAKNMARAHAEVVPATLTEDCDVHLWPEGADITMRLVRAIVAGCAAEPSLNAWYLGADRGRKLLRRIDLGIAMDTEDGLFVPVLRDIGSRDTDDLRRGLEEMKRDVSARSVPPAELRDATITLSNFGTLAGLHAALVVVPPQVAILGAGRVHPQALAADGEVTLRTVLPLSLTFDHRAVTGGEAARFLAAVKLDLEAAR